MDSTNEMGVNLLKSIAHIREEDGQIQTVEEHLQDVMELAEQHGAKIGVRHIAGLAGMLHDVGKYTKQFSNYIWKAVYDPKNAPRRGSVDHATAGGRLLYKYFHKEKSTIFEKLLVEVIGNAIISHHAYLHDYISPENINSPYLKRIRDKQLEEFTRTENTFFKKVIQRDEFNTYVDKAINELMNYLNDIKPEELEFQIMFLTKYIFSCLIDADRTNTRQFVEAEKELNIEDKDKKVRLLFKEYYQKLTEKILEFKQDPQAHSPINRLRTEMSYQCEKFAEKPSNIYTLSIPTGGGKTLASLRYALKHAKKYDKKRIVYVVPYTTIIEQNAKEVRDIIQDAFHLLEHHSNVFIEETLNEEDLAFG